MPFDGQDMARAMRLAAIAAVSAIIIATVVIGAGQFWIARSVQAAPAGQPLLIQTAG